nr:hypothetical protein Itr_chr03CG02500 [Ipomoea trifida]
MILLGSVLNENPIKLPAKGKRSRKELVVLQNIRFLRDRISFQSRRDNGLPFSPPLLPASPSATKPAADGSERRRRRASAAASPLSFDVDGDDDPSSSISGVQRRQGLKATPAMATEQRCRGGSKRRQQQSGQWPSSEAECRNGMDLPVNLLRSAAAARTGGRLFSARSASRVASGGLRR